MRRAAKIDGNHREIVRALREAGAFVHNFGRLDLLVGYEGLWYVLEIKDPESSRGKKLTKEEIFFILDVKNRAPIHLVTSPSEALAVVGALRPAAHGEGR